MNVRSPKLAESVAFPLFLPEKTSETKGEKSDRFQILSERLKKDEEEEEADASDEKESSEKAGCSKEEGNRTHVEQKAESPTKEENETSLQGTSSSTEIKGSSLQEVDVVPPKGEIGFSPQGEKRSLPRETETEGAPQAKKVCLSSLYQPNFVSVESLLPKKSFFMVSPLKNQNYIEVGRGQL